VTGQPEASLPFGQASRQGNAPSSRRRSAPPAVTSASSA